MADAITELFIRESAHRLREDYLPRIRRSVATLREGDLWWTPHGDTTSIGALLRHLRGNITQWMVAGLGGKAFARDRNAEFQGTAREEAKALLDGLDAAVAEACAVIASLDADALAREYPIQGYRVTGLRAVYHVVEHFSWHAGQITWIAKLRAGEGHGIRYYDDAALHAGIDPGAAP
jgi:uncharacterized damage-inducible protein DinB